MLTINKISENLPELNIVRDLFREYGTELNENLYFQRFDDEIENPLKKYGEPQGCIFLAYWDKEAAGCIALQELQAEGVCEMKRLYVRPSFRNKGIGDELIKVLMEEGVKKGYKKMVLDTLERLQPAIRLYQKYGFSNTSAYYENPLANVVYMEKQL